MKERISENQKKLLVTLLKYKENKIPNLVVNIKYVRICTPEFTAEQNGLKNEELVYYIDKYRSYQWTYDRSLQMLIQHGYVGCKGNTYYEGSKQYIRGTKRYFLTEKGVKLAIKIRDSMSNIVNSWSRILNYNAEELQKVGT